MKTIKLWVEPNPGHPEFQRLCWQEVQVPLRDVLLHGVHPLDGRENYSLPQAFVDRLNKTEYKPAELEPHGYANSLLVPATSYTVGSRWTRTLQRIQEDVHFVEDISYLEVLEIAKRTLRDQWSHRVARELAERAYPAFHDLRRFVKSKHKDVKLTGYGDLNAYDLGELLTLDDFIGQDNLLISEALPDLNLRKTGFLKTVTDSGGRLRLVERIDTLTLERVADGSNYVPLTWHVRRSGEGWRCYPDIANRPAKREAAKQFAERWRAGNGRLCFTTTVERLEEMVEQQVVKPSFPDLSYHFTGPPGKASATLETQHINAYRLGAYPTPQWTANDLRIVLREYGQPVSGTKTELLKKMAKLAARLYDEQAPVLEEYFAAHRFVRIGQSPSNAQILDPIAGEGALSNLVMAMFILRHLRGNAILDVTHENNTYTTANLAKALLVKRVRVEGAFVSAV